MMDPLPMIESCDECGLCCGSQSSPPGFKAWFTGRREAVYAEDREILAALPEPLRDQLASYYAVRQSSGVVDASGPCLWFDAGLKQCRHYEHRPILCREFERGGTACRQWREQRDAEATPTRE